MNKLYIFIILLLSVFQAHSQQTSENFYVTKAWISQDEEWSDFNFSGQIVVSTLAEQGSLRITNYDFLYDFSEGKAKFVNKSSYTSAEFSHPRKLSATTDKQGVVNSTYEGTLVFQSGNDYYSVIAVVTILEKNSVLGLKMHLKDNTSKEYAFSFKPS